MIKESIRPALFQPLKLGPWTLKNRVVMAPLIRMRANGRTPSPLMRQYYGQRASAGLILSEATAVSPMGAGGECTPGIWSEDQVIAWRMITHAVHLRGGLMISQLWHVGRLADPELLDGASPVGPSAIAARGAIIPHDPKRCYPVPRGLELHEIQRIVDEFRRGALNAQRAGFDGVEIHAANGYLIDQFLQDGSNQRSDRYGGSYVNRIRLLTEVIEAIVEVWGADRVGVHLSPRGDAGSMGDSNPRALFQAVARELNQRRLSFIFCREYCAADSLSQEIRNIFGGSFIANERYTAPLAERAVIDGSADAVAFGKLYIANPDLVERIAGGARLNDPEPATFYGSSSGGAAAGYVDYPCLAS